MVSKSVIDFAGGVEDRLVIDYHGSVKPLEL